jgi:hypothetical protein
VVLVAVALTACGAWAYRSVEQSLREIRSTAMRTLLDVHARAMRASIEDALEKLDPAERQRRTPEVAARYAAAAGRWGETGEVFAFDERGAILNPDHAGETTALRGRLGELHGRGVMLDPYANSRGAEVIAAWRWMPELHLGLAIELEAAEAYAPLRFLRIAFGVIFGALVLAVAAALFSGLSVLSLRRQLRGGRRIGAYVLERLIGEGGMANVYLARHDLLKRATAVKLLKPARASDEMIARFEREVQLASKLAHPNTVEIFDYGRTRDGLFYYAMEYLDGLNITELVVRGGPASVPRTIHVLRQVCAGLAEAHARGMVHRDIKPENIMVCRRGGAYDVVKILDFGLVKSFTEQHSRDITRTLRILGTPLYMSPERLRDPADVDARADIYALGAVAFYLLTGKRMFEAADDLAMTTKVLNDEPPRAADVATQAVPVELDLLIAACVEKRREDRPQRVSDLVEALDALAEEHRWSQREAEEWWSRIPPQA